MKREITQKELLTLFNYDKETGELFWKISPNRRIKIGAQAGSNHNAGYRSVKIDKKNYLVHRIVYTLYHGSCPPFIDHINRDRSDNRIKNLRASTPMENQWNRTPNMSNKTSSKYVGVSYHKKSGKWRARIRAKNREISLGYFETEQAASEAYVKGSMRHHGGLRYVDLTSWVVPNEK